MDEADCQNCQRRMQKVLTDACKIFAWKEDSKGNIGKVWCAFYEPIKEDRCQKGPK